MSVILLENGVISEVGSSRPNLPNTRNEIYGYEETPTDIESYIWRSYSNGKIHRLYNLDNICNSCNNCPDIKKKKTKIVIRSRVLATSWIDSRILGFSKTTSDSSEGSNHSFLFIYASIPAYK